MTTDTVHYPEELSPDDAIHGISGHMRPALGRIVEITDEDENIVPAFISVPDFNR